MTEMMNAMVLTGHGGLDKLEYRQVPIPVPGPDDILIKVGACGMNNTDVNTRSGWYSKTVTEATTGGAYGEVDDTESTWGGAGVSFPRIQGADTVGEVVAVGTNADAGVIGKRIIVDCWLRDWDDPLNMDKMGYFGSERDGGYAEYTTVDRRNFRVIESDLSDAELATFSCSWSTAEGMLNRANVGADDTVLVTGASGGVGSALIGLARRRGARVVALASESKHAALKDTGAILLPRGPENLGDALEAATGNREVSVVADIVGGDYFGSLIDALERGGRYTCSGAIAGPIVDLDLRTFYLRDLTFTGSTCIPPHVFGDLVGYIERGEVAPMLAATYPLKDFHAAQQVFIDKAHVGNIVVVP